MPQLVAGTDLTGQGAASGTITILTTTVAGQYLLTWNARKTTADGVSSTLGALTITYVDPDNTTITLTAGAFVAAGTVATTNATDSATSTGALIGIPIMLNCKSGSAVTLSMAYVSNTPGNMVYNFHAKLTLILTS